MDYISRAWMGGRGETWERLQWDGKRIRKVTLTLG